MQAPPLKLELDAMPSTSTNDTLPQILLLPDQIKTERASSPTDSQDQSTPQYIFLTANGLMNSNSPEHPSNDPITLEANSARSLAEDERLLVLTRNVRDIEWGISDTKVLLDKFAQYIHQIGPTKTFRNKKAMWTQVSKDIKDTLNLDRSAAQCENRYKTIKRRKTYRLFNDNEPYANVLINQETTNEDDDEEAEFITSTLSSPDHNDHNSLSDTLLSRVRDISSTGYKRPAADELDTQPPAKMTPSVLASVSKTLLEICRIKEEGRERRHREKMQLLQQLFSRR